MLIDLKNKTVEIFEPIEIGYIISYLNEVGINNYSIFKVIFKSNHITDGIVENTNQLKLFNDGE